MCIASISHNVGQRGIQCEEGTRKTACPPTFTIALLHCVADAHVLKDAARVDGDR